MSITFTRRGRKLLIFINEILHIAIDIASVRVVCSHFSGANEDKRYHIMVSLDGQKPEEKITFTYDGLEKWKSVLKIIEEEISRISV